jgi:uncharacterized protein (DUF433 family)
MGLAATVDKRYNVYSQCFSDMRSKVLSMRIQEAQDERLQRVARKLGHSPAEAGALLIEEGLRRTEFAFIDFRHNAAGRQAYLQGSRLPVWMVVKIARSYGGSIDKTAEHLQRPPVQIQAAMNYAKAFPEEIEPAIKDNDSYQFGKLSQMLPQARPFESSFEGK